MDCGHALCTDGRTIVAAEGEYLAIQADGSVKSYACPFGYCRSGTTCNTTYTASAAVLVCCGENRAPSPLCGQCKPGYMEVSGQCIICDEPNSGLIVLLLLVAVVFLVVFHRLAQAQNPFTKQLFYFLQMAELLFGPSVSMTQILNLFNFNVYESAGAVCVVPLSPAGRLVMGVTIPVLQIALLAVVSMVHGLLWLLAQRCRLRLLGRLLPGGDKFKRSPYIRTACVLMLSSYNAITETVIEFFSCIQVDETARVIATVPALSCDSAEYSAIRPLFLFFLVAVVIGLPLGLFIFLFWAQQKRRLFTGKYRERYGTVFEVYEPRYYYYEVVVLIRRVVIIGIVQLRGEGRIEALSWCAFAGCIFLVLHFLLKPFSKPLFNATEAVTLIFLLLVTTALCALPLPLTSGALIVLALLVFLPTFALGLMTVAFMASKSSTVMTKVAPRTGSSRLLAGLQWIREESELGAVPFSVESDAGKKGPTVGLELREQLLPVADTTMGAGGSA